MRPKSVTANNSMQRTALRAAADAKRSVERDQVHNSHYRFPDGLNDDGA
jgi:hypothetical protein